MAGQRLEKLAATLLRTGRCVRDEAPRRGRERGHTLAASRRFGFPGASNLLCAPLSKPHESIFNPGTSPSLPAEVAANKECFQAIVDEGKKKVLRIASHLALVAVPVLMMAKF